jgi:branched-chain amino acid transport system ATP-binding protein
MAEPLLLETRGLTAHYGDAQALYGVDIAVARGQIVAIIGANGAGKSTLLNSIVGLVGVAREAVRFEGEPIGGLPPYEIVARGLALVPEGRRLFPSLNVEENLRIGGQVGRKGRWTLATVYDVFPALAERRAMPVSALSGGQQQMAAIGRALMSNPKLLLCDELSLGLAPIVVRDIYARLAEVVASGVSAVVVEQDITQALKVAGHVYCMLEGRVALQGGAGALTRAAIAAAYFGV